MFIGSQFKKINPRYKRHYFSGLSFNSKKCKKDNIFFAIRGNKLDGNIFINQAIKNGAKTIISNLKFEGIKKNILYIRSTNVRKLLSKTTYNIYKDKPKNLILIYSNPNKSAILYDAPEYFDKTFNNVLENENVKEQNCTGQKCKDCLACYKFNDVNVIVEKVKKY